MPRMLLLSNSANHGSEMLEHALDVVGDHLAGIHELLFVPFARSDHDAYTARLSAALEPLNVVVRGLHAPTDAVEAVRGAEAVFVGGGNTFRLVRTLQTLGLIDEIAAAVARGTIYMGASAGTNIAAPTLRTTNDMPIVEPSSFATLGLVPFQINPHFIDADPSSTHAGETRETRLAEFHEDNDVDVLGLREGTHLRVAGSFDQGDLTASIGGAAVGANAPGPAILFRRGDTPREVAGDVSALFARTQRFDAPRGE